MSECDREAPSWEAMARNRIEAPRRGHGGDEIAEKFCTIWGEMRNAPNHRLINPVADGKSMLI